MHTRMSGSNNYATGWCAVAYLISTTHFELRYCQLDLGSFIPGHLFAANHHITLLASLCTKIVRGKENTSTLEHKLRKEIAFGHRVACISRLTDLGVTAHVRERHVPGTIALATNAHDGQARKLEDLHSIVNDHIARP